MKIDELKKAIRGLIREEIQKVLSEEVNKAMGKVLVEMVKEIKSSDSSSQIIEENVNRNVPSINTKNPKLNSVLMETARYSKPLQKSVHRPTSGLVELMDGGFDKIGSHEELIASEPATNMDFLKQMVGESPTIAQPSVLDGGVEIPDTLQKIFKQDFRKIMKKIDESKKPATIMFPK